MYTTPTTHDLNAYNKDVMYNRVYQQPQLQHAPIPPQQLHSHQQNLLFSRDRISPSTSPVHSRLPLAPTRSPTIPQARQALPTYINNTIEHAERAQYNPYSNNKSVYASENNTWQQTPQSWYHPNTPQHSLSWHQNQISNGPQNIDPGKFISVVFFLHLCS